MSETLEITTPDEIAPHTLAQCEEIIKQCDADMDRAFIKKGTILIEIKTHRLYKSDFPTFEEYCQTVLGMSRSSAYDYINAATVGRALQNEGKEIPTTIRRTLAAGTAQKREMLEERGHQRVVGIMEAFEEFEARMNPDNPLLCQQLVWIRDNRLWKYALIGVGSFEAYTKRLPLPEEYVQSLIAGADKVIAAHALSGHLPPPDDPPAVMPEAFYRDSEEVNSSHDKFIAKLENLGFDIEKFNTLEDWVFEAA